MSHADEPNYRRALDNLLMGFQIIGFDWRYLYVNPAAARHGHTTPAALVGRTMMEAFPGIDDTPLFPVLQQCMLERTAQVFENEFTFPDGERRWFDLRVEPLDEGICVYSTDIHSRKMAEVETASRTDRLEQQLGTLEQLWRRFVASALPTD